MSSESLICRNPPGITTTNLTRQPVEQPRQTLTIRPEPQTIDDEIVTDSQECRPLQRLALGPNARKPKVVTMPPIRASSKPTEAPQTSEAPSDPATPATPSAPTAPPPAAPKRKQAPTPQSTEPKILPPYQVVLLNDDDHTYEYVIRLLMKVFRLDVKKAFILTRKIDKHDRAAVWSGTKELAELKQQQVRTFGPDTYAAHTVTYPIGCLIEPMPQ